MKDATVEADLAEHEVKYASKQEAESAVRALTSAEKKKLMVIAMYWCRKFFLNGTSMQPEDLFQEALFRTLKAEDGKRWPLHIPFVKHLDRSMENIAGHYRASMKAEGTAKRTTRALDPPARKEGVSAAAPIHTDHLEDQLDARDEVERLQDFFGEDTQGFRAVVCQASGMSTTEILEDLGINSKEWETVRKRVQRKLAKYVATKEEEK